MIRTFCLVFILISSSANSQSLVLNEFTSGNSTFQDSYGETPDWVELKNISAATLCLNAYGISDDRDPSKAWPLPDTCIAPGSFIIIFCSGDQPDRYHADFSLRRHQEGVYLFENGSLKDSFPVVCMPENHSFGLDPSNNTRIHFTNPTPGNENDAASSKIITALKDSLQLLTTPGFYGGAVSLSLNSMDGTPVFYTTNGTPPWDSDAKRYDPGLILTAEGIGKETQSLIPTSGQWREPKADVFNGYAIRAVAMSQGCPVSNEVKGSFFIHPAGRSRYRLPVFSIITDPDGFFSKKEGIYVKGEADNIEQANFFKKGKKWARESNLEFFTTDGLIFSQDFEARIHGRHTRLNPQKSLRLYSMDGESFNYPFFGNRLTEFKSLVLQTVDKHASSGMFKDELINFILKDERIGTLASMPSIVFINGEYWGVHNLRERQDKYYLENHYKADIENIDFLSYELNGPETIEGSESEYNRFITSVMSLDLKQPEAMSELEKLMDVDNFINYSIAHIYFANFDWPHNNVRIWKERNSDGKWRWMFYDCDLCMLHSDYDPIFKNLTSISYNGQLAELITAVLQNKEFRTRFYQRFLYHLMNTFHPVKMLSAIEQFESIYYPYVFEHIDRWQIPESFSAWQGHIATMRSFSIERQEIMLQMLVNYFGSPVTVYPNPATDNINVSFMNSETFMLRIIDCRGSIIKNFQSGNNPINISDLSPGLYLLEASYGELKFATKLVKN